MPDQFIVDGVPHEVDSSPLEKLYASDEIRLKRKTNHNVLGSTWLSGSLESRASSYFKYFAAK